MVELTCIIHRNCHTWKEIFPELVDPSKSTIILISFIQHL